MLVFGMGQLKESGIRTTRPLPRGSVTLLPADHPGSGLLDQGEEEAGVRFLAGLETALVRDHGQAVWSHGSVCDVRLSFQHFRTVGEREAAQPDQPPICLLHFGVRVREQPPLFRHLRPYRHRRWGGVL
jgi:hypothetical protein